MARQEDDRDDLYEEFRSAQQKWELQVAEKPDHIICGIRKDGRYSIYFNQNDCYHFNTNLELQRAYQDGSLYRSQGTTLAKLNRQRTDNETILLRVDLSKSDLTHFLTKLQESMNEFHNCLINQTYQIIRSDPAGADIEAIRAAIEKFAHQKIQLATAYPTKRK